jgi:ATP-dependent DNA helicase RecQ
LSEDGFLARPFNGKMDKVEKIANQNAFMSGEVDIIVATSAFGMGVDKSDVGAVIHYDHFKFIGKLYPGSRPCRKR